MTLPQSFDENNADAYYEDWLEYCGKDDTASNGERVTSALALRIAADVMKFFDPDIPNHKCLWTVDDIKLARAAIAGIRAQQGIVSADSKAILRNGDDGWHATRQLDVWIYG